jgi:hypothetical protein
MNKSIGFFLALSIFYIWVTGDAAAQAQTNTVNEEVPIQTTPPRRSLRIIFEGTFQSGRNKNFQEQGMIFPTIYPSDQDESSLSNSTDPLLSTNPFFTNQRLPQYYNNYGASSGYKDMIIGFDSNFTQRSGRRFTVSARTRFIKYTEPNYTTRETWVKLHTEGKKQSSIVVDFAIKIVN